MAKDPEQLAHQEWLGYVQPVGLVVSIPALLAAQAMSTATSSPIISGFWIACRVKLDDEADPRDPRFPRVHADRSSAGSRPIWWTGGRRRGRSGVPGSPAPGIQRNAPAHLCRPGIRAATDAEHPWMMLIQSFPTGTTSTRAEREDHRTGRPARRPASSGCCARRECRSGLLFNGTHLRLVYAPRGETSGYLTFPVAAMAEVAGRPIFAALHMLLCGERLFSLPEKQRLPAILADSRKYQNVVSTQLAEQVLAALYELVRGFQAADDQRKGELLARRARARIPNHVYAGLLTVLMRLVFILYAEDRGLLSERSGLRELLLGHRAVRAAAGRRRPLSRHDGPALRGLGAAPDALPPDLRGRQPRRVADSGPQGLPVRPRPLPLPRRPGLEDAATVWAKRTDPRAFPTA